MDDKNIYELRKNVSLIAEEKFKIYKENQNDQNRNVYRRVLNIYESISNAKTKREIENTFKYIDKNIKEIQTKQNELHKKYLETNDNSQYEMLIEYKITLETYEEIKDLIKIYLSKENSNTQLPNLNNEINSETINEETKSKTHSNFLDSLNQTILEEREKMIEFDINSQEFINKNKKIYNLCIDRENYVKKHFGYEGINILLEIESLEQRIALFNPSNNEELYKKEYSSIELKEELIKIINKLSDKLFNNNSAKNEIQDYRNIIKTVFINNYINIEVYDLTNIKDNFNSVTTTEELISLLTLYNLDGSYEKFCEKYKKASIGSNKLTKQQYQIQISRLRLFIERLVYLVEQKLKKENDKITIKNNTSEKEKLTKQLNQKIEELKNIQEKSISR